MNFESGQPLSFKLRVYLCDHLSNKDISEISRQVRISSHTLKRMMNIIYPLEITVLNKVAVIPMMRRAIANKMKK